VIVDCMTNNRNRTVADVRHVFTKHGGNLGTDGSVAYLFKKQGQMTFAPGVDEERLMEIALECNAEDVIVSEDGSVEILAAPENFLQMKAAIIKAGFHPAQAEVTMAAVTQVPITDKEVAERFMQMIDTLEDLDDVQTVYSNADIDSVILNEIS